MVQLNSPMGSAGRTTIQYLKNLAVKQEKAFIDRLLASCVSGYRKQRSLLAQIKSPWVSKLYLNYRGAERAISGKKICFVTLNELTQWTSQWVRNFPVSFDLIVGVPRSGLLVGSIIAAKLGKPLTTPEGFARNEIWMSERSANKNLRYDKILLVDDTVGRGRQLAKALAQFQPGDFQVTTAAVIATEEGTTHVDLYYRRISDPILCEWNMLHAKKGNLAVALEGVLCHDLPRGMRADEKAYLTWVRSARAYLVPTFEIDAIVAVRDPKYRADTEEWLAEHRIAYKNLILWDAVGPVADEARQIRYKIDSLFKLKPDLYWEAGYGAAAEICRRTKIPTLCIDRMALIS